MRIARRAVGSYQVKRVGLVMVADRPSTLGGKIMAQKKEEKFILTPKGVVSRFPDGVEVLNALELFARRQAKEGEIPAIIFDEAFGKFGVVFLKLEEA